MFKKSALRRVKALFRALDRSVREATDREIADELKALKIDQLKAVQQVKFAIDGAVDEFYATRLKCDRERIGQPLSGYRDLLVETLRGNGSAQLALADEFPGRSDIEQLSDAEVSRAIRCLVVLGFINVRRESYD